MPSHSATPSPSPGPSGRTGPRRGVYILDRAGARAIDALAVERYRMASIVLMENAAREVAHTALDLLDDVDEPRVVVVCGPGNNGGDGLAAARHLHNAGAHVCILLAADADRLGGDAAANFAIVQGMHLPLIGVEPPGLPADAERAANAAAERLGGTDLIVDALLGTGLDRPVREPLASLIRWMNAHAEKGTPVLAVDVPSGLDCDTGRPLGVAVTADVTVSFCGPKRGYLTLEAQQYVGEVVVGDIGVPRELVEEIGVMNSARPPGSDESEAGEPPPAAPKRGDSAS